MNNNCEFLLRRQYIYFHSSKELRCKWIPKTDFTMKFSLDMSTKNSSANNTLFSKERKIVHGRSRHPQSQGSVERANADVKEMLATWLSENNST